MPNCRLFTSKTKTLKSFGQPVLPDRFPDNVVKIDVLPDRFRPIAFSGNHHEISYENLANLITNTPKRFDEIVIGSSSETSPEYLRFVSVACQKTKTLTVGESIRDATPQLCASLKAQLVEGGIEEFRFNMHGLTPTRQQKELSVSLFQGIARSKSLKKLNIALTSHEFQGHQLIHALKKNKTLKTLDLNTAPPNSDRNDSRMMEKIFRTCIQKTQVSELHLREFSFQGGTQILNQNVFIDCLCKRSCAVEKLHLDRITLERDSKPESDDDVENHVSILDEKLVDCLRSLHDMLSSARIDDPEESSGMRDIANMMMSMAHKSLAILDKNEADVATVTNNTSVKELHITKANLGSVQLRKILPRFKSLVVLDLQRNNLWNIAPLTNLLPSMQKLDLQDNIIDSDEIQDLLKELPKMSSLQSLDLSMNPCVLCGKFVNKRGAGKLENAVLRNNKIERLRYCHVKDDFDKREYNSDRDDFDMTDILGFRSLYDKKKIKAHLSINRGGRAHLQEKCTLPSGIWPLILERASKLKYCGWNGSMTATDTRKDVVYWLLREKVVAESGI